MPRRDENLPFLLRLLTAVGENAPTILRKIELMRSSRRHSDEWAHKIDCYLLEEIERQRTALLEAKANQKELKGVLDKLAATPWHAAVYLERVETEHGLRVMVMHGGSRRAVALADGVNADSLKKGDDVFLGNELNVVMHKAANGAPRCGEIAVFERCTADGRLVIKHRGNEEVLVDIGGAMRETELKTGDLVRWDRDCSMAMEKLPRPEHDQFFQHNIPDIGRDRVGGQSANIEVLLAALTATLVAPDKAASYGLGGRESVLMVGPPGCGKTLMARVAAAEIARLNGTRCRFSVVKPGEFEDPYVGVTQQRIRDCFEGLRRAAADGFAILFLDEIEAVGRTRGGVVTHHSDKFLAALLAELDGFTDRSNVAIIAATNRKELIDPALLERLSDLEIVVDRPDMGGARAIFEVHLPESLLYASNGTAGGGTRREMIETAASLLYSPNGDNELCTLRFRDGKTRTVTARELASGRCFEQICRAARRAAFQRDVRDGEQGLCVADIEKAVAEAMTKLASTLTRGNVHTYLSNLPQDVDVVSVAPIARRVAHPNRYLNVV